MILAVGLYYGNSARNARVQFEERRYLFYAITAELTFSTVYNAVRAIHPVPFHQDVTFIAAFLRGLSTNTLALFIIFVPKVSADGGRGRSFRRSVAFCVCARGGWGYPRNN